MTALPQPADAKWLRADTDNFIIYSEGSEKSLREFSELLQRFDATLRTRFGIGSGLEPNRLTIFLLPRSTDVHKLSPRTLGPSIAGFYSPSLEGTYAVSNRESHTVKGTSQAQQTLFHEYTHHFMRRYLSAAFPAWFVEGFAEYYSTTDYTKTGQAKIGMPAYARAYGLLNLPKVPAETLLFQRPGAMRNSGQMDVYYGRAWLLTHMLYYHPGRSGQLATYMEALNKGDDSKKAAADAFGDLAELDKDLNRYMTKPMSYRLTATPIPISGSITIRALSPAEDAVLPLHLRRKAAQDDEQRSKIRDDLRKLSATHSTDASIWFETAAVEWDMDEDVRDLAAVRTALDRTLAIEPKHVHANVLLSRLLIKELDDKGGTDAAAWNAARKPVILANRTDPNSPWPLYIYFTSFLAQGIEPPAIAFDGLARAFDIARESPSVRILQIQALADQKKFDQAIELAKVLAFDPHDNGSGEALLDQIEQMRAMAKKTARAKAAASAEAESE
ncbi:MAG: hypothetical protein U0S50_02590 [Sphingopyxis sp.]|uniref:hypothetical protein n=1 Tax=Sphingopyxis sp. TaxID=1908224 RepID=UPI002AB8654B|nr:hypothetical protein [Sphingopyxis sp.]MDZ3830690.1 hypothetical protein [Sphingopyxis sp.]